MAGDAAARFHAVHALYPHPRSRLARACRWRSVTGETWNGLMYDFAVTTDCDDDPPFDEQFPTGCGNSISYAYFYSFIVINVFVIVQLLIAVVLEAFSDITDVRALCAAGGTCGMNRLHDVCWPVSRAGGLSEAQP